MPEDVELCESCDSEGATISNCTCGYMDRYKKKSNDRAFHTGWAVVKEYPHGTGIFPKKCSKCDSKDIETDYTVGAIKCNDCGSYFADLDDIEGER